MHSNDRCAKRRQTIPTILVPLLSCAPDGFQIFLSSLFAHGTILQKHAEKFPDYFFSLKPRSPSLANFALSLTLPRKRRRES